MERTGHFKRKRKLSFLKRVKKYSKKGNSNQGHGTHIEQDVFDYYCRVLVVWNKGFDSEEDKRVFADNVLEQARGCELDLATNQLTSRAIETILESASPELVKDILESALRLDLRIAFEDTFSSHLTQKLILASAKRVAASELDPDESFAVVCIKFAVNNIEEFAWHVSACHVARSCLQAISLMGDKISQEYPKLYYGALIESPIVVDISRVELGSGLLQALLHCLKETKQKLCQKSISTLLKLVFSPETTPDNNESEKKTDPATIPPVFTSLPTIRLLECAIECSTSKRFTQIYALLFINRLKTLAVGHPSNMSVQALIRASIEKTEFESIFDELLDSFKEILSHRRTGIFMSLASKCETLCTRQGQFLIGLIKCLGCSESDQSSDLCERCLSLESYASSSAEPERKEKMHAPGADCKDGTIVQPFSREGKDNVSLMGSLIIQSMLRFQKPIKVISSLLSMDTEKLVKMFCDPRGSHISDTFFSAKYVGEKSKDKLFHKIKDNLVDLAVSKHGSRSFEAMWSGLSAKHREKAAAKLAERESVVTGSMYGCIVANKIHLTSYRKDPKGWAATISSAFTTQKLFSDIIGNR